MDSESPESLLVRHRYAVLTATGLAMWVAFLGLRSFWYPDEPDIAEVCAAMYHSGDWIVPRRNGVDWVDYPPLLYWLGCISASALGGLSEFALRLPSALAAIALALATCAAGSRAFGPRAGLWAGALLMTFVQIGFNATSYRTDMVFAAFVGIGTLLHAAGAGARPNAWLRIAGFGMFGLAVLTKGPIGVLLPGMVLTLHHGGRREFRRVFELAPLALVSIAIALPWFLACADAMPSFWDDIYGQNFRRFREAQVGRGHIQPWYYYLKSIWSDLAPWSPLLPFAVAWALRDRRFTDRLTSLALWWFGASFVFWSIALTKRQLYLLPAYPAIALLTARWIATPGASERVLRVFVTAFWILLAVVGPAALAAGALLDPLIDWVGPKPERAALAGQMRPALIVAGLVSSAGAWWIRRGADLGRVAIASAALYCVAFGTVYPVIDRSKTYAPQCAWLREQADGAERIGLFYTDIGHHKKGAFAYYTGILVEVIADRAGLETFFAAHPNSVAIVHEPDWRRLLDQSPLPWQERVLRTMRISNRDFVILAPPR